MLLAVIDFKSNGTCKSTLTHGLHHTVQKGALTETCLLFSSEWTTEKEINVFKDWGISGTISQTIDGSLLENLIPFRRGGSFEVKGRLSIPSPDDIRTEFEFESATLDFGKWGSYTLPPIGKGWFDTVYLDDDLRVDINSRDDILICTPAEE